VVAATTLIVVTVRKRMDTKERKDGEANGGGAALA
jgi:hypothetical protein